MNYGGGQTDYAQSANALMRDWIGTRKKISLWLSLTKPDDLDAYNIISSMKSKRLFRSSVMLGLKMVYELRQGRVDTLLKEFPQVVEWLKVAVTPPNSDGGGQMDNIQGMLEIILATQKTGNGYEMKSTALPKPVNGAGDTAPPVAVVSAASAANADTIADNFLSAFF